MKYDEKELLFDLEWDNEIAIQAAAYSVYQKLLPKDREPITPKQFHNLFDRNLLTFHKLIDEEMDE